MCGGSPIPGGPCRRKVPDLDMGGYKGMYSGVLPITGFTGLGFGMVGSGLILAGLLALRLARVGGRSRGGRR
jgi:hypothetical protein